MKIYISHSTSFDFKNGLYNPIKGSVLNTQHQIHFPHDEKEVNSKEIIKNSDIIIAEVSHASTGQGIELGWANMLQVPIFCIYNVTSKISASLQMVAKEFIEYKDEGEMLSKLSEAINNYGKN